MKKRILSLLLCCVILVGGMPTTTFAADDGSTNTGKAIQLGMSQIMGGQASNVYFGNYKQSSNGSGGYNTDPIKWRVLFNAYGKMFLLADQNLDTNKYNNEKVNITWEESTIRSWLNGYGAVANKESTDYSSNNFIDAAFSGGEQRAIAETYVYNATQSNGRSKPNPNSNTPGGNNTTDKIFLLSMEEANKSSYFPNGDGSRICTNTAYAASHVYGGIAGGAYDWWLRSPGSIPNTATYVSDSGKVDYQGTSVHNVYRMTRPAFNLNASSVLFTAAAEGGKVDTAVDKNLTAVGTGTKEWKLTLKDAGRHNFSASTNSNTTNDEGYSDWTVNVSYENAKKGYNEYVSAMIADKNGTILYYGRIANNSASGAARVTIPAGLVPGSYTLKVFSEQYNGDKKTDYASDFKDIALTVEKREKFSLDPGSTYYFDLSGESIPGTVNAALPDTKRHYIPFTYVGKVKAYKLTSEMMTTEAYAQQNKYAHSLFVADYAVTHTIGWDTLNTNGLIFGKNYTEGGVDYILRVPSVGSYYTGSGDPVCGTPANNEWDTILNKNSEFIKNWSGMYSWGQDTTNFATVYRSLRGCDSGSKWSYSSPNNYKESFGFRPVLEVMNADTLGYDGLKAVTLDLNGGKLGESSNDIQIIVKKGSTFTAPASDGLTRPDGDTGSYFMWLDDNGNSYAPGDSVPATVAELSVQWAAPTYTVTLHANGGTINSGNVTGYTYGVGATLPTDDDMTYTGHTFKGWYDNENLTGSPVTAIGGTEKGNKEYWAKWKVNQYTVTIKPENGEADITITQDYGTPITAPALTREGYQFNGWDKTFPTTMPAENLTITAQWIDVAAPTGEIKIAENGWKSFFNNITFGLFFKDTQTVTVTAADNSGEAVTIEYLLSDKALTQAELANMTFAAYAAPFAINPDNEYVIYAKLTDTSGNVAYINTDGIVLDATVPVISGIEAGKTYCAAQTVTVTEKYIGTVTVNGNAVTLDGNNQFTLNPADGEQTIVVTDKAGNETRVTVTVNNGHTYKWQSKNGQYWQKCKFCGDETAKKDIPTINISGADKVCRTQDYKFSFTLPEGATDTAYGYEFTGLGDGPLTPTVENGLYSGIIKASTYPAEENSFKLIVSAKTADGFTFSAEKTVTIQNEHTGGTATCTDKAICEICGESYGELDGNNHADMKHIEAKAATKTAEGNIEYWYCEGCGKYFADKDGAKEITKTDTVTAKLPDDSKSPQTGDTSNLTLWIALLFISGGTVTATTVYGRKKRSVK